MTTFTDASVVVLKTTHDNALKNLENAIDYMWEGIECTDAAQPPRNMTWGADELYSLERMLVRGMVELRATKRILEWDLPAEPGETLMFPRQKFDDAMAQMGYAVNQINWMLGELNPSLDPWMAPLDYRAMERTFVQTIQYIKSAIRELELS
jgi:hypothetical protein